MNESKMEESSTLFTNREPFYSFFFLNNSERKCIQVVHNQFNPVYCTLFAQSKKNDHTKARKHDFFLRQIT
jgi:hypothetical protein